MAFNVPGTKPFLSELDLRMEAVEAGLLSLQDSASIEVVSGSTENSAKFNVLPFALVAGELAEGSAIALTSGTALNVLSITLPAGRWLVFGAVGYAPVGGPTLSAAAQGVSLTPATVSSTGLDFSQARESGALVTRPRYPIPATYLELLGSAPLYLCAQASFSGGTSLSVYGRVRALKLP